MQNSLSLKTGPINLAGTSGNLECFLEVANDTAKFSALVCHPNPLQGGTFNNKVVTSLTRLCRRNSGVALRFNFRGVGASEGEHDGGLGESQDAFQLLDWLRQQNKQPLWLAGFSFGSMVAAKAAVLSAKQGKPVDHLLLVAPPVEQYSWPDLADCDCPITIIQGDDDEVVDANAVAAFVEKQQPKPVIIRLSECGHFFHGRLSELMQAAKQSLP